jgi:hypothetical protein
MFWRALQNDHFLARDRKFAGNGQADDACADDDNVNFVQKNA